MQRLHHGGLRVCGGQRLAIPHRHRCERWRSECRGPGCNSLHKIIGEAAGPANAIELGEVADGVVIEGNWISGDFNAAFKSGSAPTNLLIKDNYIRNVNAADWAIELTAATGLCVGNRLAADAAATTLDPGPLMCVDNEMVNAIDRSSIPMPTTATGVLPTVLSARQLRGWRHRRGCYRQVMPSMQRLSQQAPSMQMQSQIMPSMRARLQRMPSPASS